MFRINKHLLLNASLRGCICGLIFSLDGTVRLWDIRKPSALSIFKRYARDQNISNHFPTSFCFSLNMPCRLFVIYSNGDIVTWDTQTGKNVHFLFWRLLERHIYKWSWCKLVVLPTKNTDFPFGWWHYNTFKQVCIGHSELPNWRSDKLASARPYRIHYLLYHERQIRRDLFGLAGGF